MTSLFRLVVEVLRMGITTVDRRQSRCGVRAEANFEFIYEVTEAPNSQGVPKSVPY
jgi:hypothetical protein